MTATSNPRVRPGSSVGFVAAGGQCRCDIAARDIFDVRFTSGQPLDPYLVDVEADDVKAGLDRPHGDRKPGVALTNDNQAIQFWHRHYVPAGSGLKPDDSCRWCAAEC